jgi:Tfp pilus assembly protein PilX
VQTVLLKALMLLLVLGLFAICGALVMFAESVISARPESSEESMS